MAYDSLNPPPKSGNAKYAVIGLLLLAGAAGLWFLVNKPAEQPAKQTTATPDAGSGRSSAMADTEMVMPDEEADAGETTEQAPTKRKIVYKYVNGDWDCSGDIAAAQIKAFFAEQSQQVRNCYERRLKVNNTLQGTLKLSLKIGQQGQVLATRTGGTIGDNEVFSCVRSLANKWHLPNPSGGSCAVVQVPFNFTPQN